LKKLKELYPSSTPFTVKSKTGLFTRLAESWGIGATNFSAYYDEEAKQWKHMVNDPKFKEILDYVKKLYDEKLLDQEFLTITEAAWTAKMTQPDKAFVTNDWIGRMSQMKEATKSTYPEFDLRYAPPIGPTQKVISLPLVDHGPGIKKGKNSVLAMKLCDYLISPSGAQLLTLGIEGVTYTIGEDGFADYIGFDDGQTITINELENKYGMFISSMYHRFDHRSIYYQFTEQEQEAQDMMLNKEDGFEPADPKLTFNAEEKSVIDSNQSKIQAAAEEFASKYILSNETGDAAWNTWLQRMDDLGVNDVVKAYNSAQSRYDQLQ
jgi:putative aldouronate transport system substrate-binding protein